MICWPPAHFNPEQAAYSDSVCKGKLENLLQENETDVESKGIYRSFVKAIIPKEANRSDYLLTEEDFMPTTSDSSNNNEDDLTLYWYVLGELVVACIVYLFCLQVAAQKRILNDIAHRQKVTKEKKLNAMYLLVVLALCVVWLILGCLCYANCVDNGDTDDIEGKEFQKNGIVMCDMALRILGNVQRYTLQCKYDIMIPIQSSGAQIVRLEHVAAVANTALCFFMFAVYLMIIIAGTFRHFVSSPPTGEVHEKLDEEMKPI